MVKQSEAPRESASGQTAAEKRRQTIERHRQQELQEQEKIQRETAGMFIRQVLTV